MLSLLALSDRLPRRKIKMRKAKAHSDIKLVRCLKDSKKAHGTVCLASIRGS